MEFNVFQFIDILISNDPSSCCTRLCIKPNDNGLRERDSAIFQLYHGENKLIFNKMMTRFALY